jgi:hypothetical protein
MAFNIIIQENCPVCLKELFDQNESCFAHAPSDTSHVHALCMQCFDHIRAQNQENTIQCPLCRVVVPFTEGRVGDVIPVDLPRAVEVRPRDFEGDINHAFVQAIEQRDYDQVRALVVDLELSERVVQESFQNAINPFRTNEEVANIIYFSNRLDQDFLEWALDSVWFTVENGRLRLF